MTIFQASVCRASWWTSWRCCRLQYRKWISFGKLALIAQKISRSFFDIFNLHRCPFVVIPIHRSSPMSTEEASWHILVGDISCFSHIYITFDQVQRSCRNFILFYDDCVWWHLIFLFVSQLWSRCLQNTIQLNTCLLLKQLNLRHKQ